MKKKVLELVCIWDGKKLLTKDFTNLDLSGLDLSSIPEQAWEGCIFNNTNFRNTRIRFRPRKLHKFSKYEWSKDKEEYLFTVMENCDFEGCDLSYLDQKDMVQVKVNGCNFNNTGLNVDFSNLPMFESMTSFIDYRYTTINVRGVKFDKNYDEYDSNHWENLTLDIETLCLNPNIHVSSVKLYELIKHSLQNAEILLTREEIEKEVARCEEYLKFDRDGDLVRFYEIIKSKTDMTGRYKFFHYIVENISFKDIDLGLIPKSILEMTRFRNCEYENTILRTDMASLTSLRPKFREISSKYTSVILPGVTPESWQEKQGNRVENTPITFRTNVYVELSRICNASCVFCRNNSFDRCRYSLGSIKKSLLAIYPHLDDIVVGGGEPTLRVEDLRDLRLWLIKHGKNRNTNWYIFTNGTLNRNELKGLNRIEAEVHNEKRSYNGYSFNISRHAVKGSDNAKIFGVSESMLYDEKDLEWIAESTTETTLCATCFEGGLDSFDKIIQYIKFAQQLGFGRVLLSTLHKDNSSGKRNVTGETMNIEETIFEQVMEYLQGFGFERKIPIYSTGGYKSTVLSNSDNMGHKFTVAFKDYLTKEELDDKWPKALKRTFDLSINPTGEIFENWHQKSGLVMAKTIKPR